MGLLSHLPLRGPIAVVAPSGVHGIERFQAGLAILREAGLDPRPLPGLLRPERYLAAPDEHRLAQLHEALTAPGYAAVWAARGGYGLTRLIDRLERTGLPPRPVLGFSDLTALFAALHRAGAGPCIHAPVVHSLKGTDEASRAHLFDLLAGRPVAPLHGETWADGAATGPLLGGNLCLLAALCGTPQQLDVRGAILVLEDLAEPPYRIDRMLQQLRASGALDGVAGFALGQFDRCAPPVSATWTLRDVFLDHLGRGDVPVVAGLPIGHGPANRAFPWGARATLEAGSLRWELD